MGTTSVEPAALLTAAQRIETASEMVLDAVQLRLQFDGSSAGRAHTAAGGAIRAAAESMVADARRWALAADEVVVALRTAADLRAAEEAHAAAVLS